MAEALADMQPERHTNSGRSGRNICVKMVRDAERRNIISRVDVSGLDEPDTIARLLVELAPLVGATGDEQYEIVAVTPLADGQEGRFVEFRQLVNGIPFNNTSSLSVTSEGEVTSFAVYLLDLSEYVVAAPSVMTLEQAEQLALAEFGLQDPGMAIRDGETRPK